MADAAEPYASATTTTGPAIARPAATSPVAASATAKAGWLDRVRAMPLAERAFAAILVAFVFKQLFAVAAFPAFSGHDEVAHFAYIRVLATEGRIPVLPDLSEWRRNRQLNPSRSSDFLPPELYPWCRFALDWHCEPLDPQWGTTPPYAVQLQGRYYPVGFIYTANHPPLYYALMSPIYLLSRAFSLEGQQALLRLAAIPFGIATIVLAYIMTRMIYPRDTFLPVTVPAFVAFQPQISYESAMVNNDILGIAAFALILYLCVRGLRDGFPRRLSLALGVALGLAQLAKGTSLIALPVVGLAVLLALGVRNVKGLALRAFWIGLPMTVLAAPWYAFLYRTYGNFDALEQIAALQYNNRSLGTFFEILFDRDFAVMRFRETWGEYGWRQLPLDPRLLWAIGIVSALSVVGLATYAYWTWRSPPPAWADATFALAPWQVQSLCILFITCVIGYVAVVQFGTSFSLTQARYFFPVATAAALLSMLGLRTLLPTAWRPLGRGVVVTAFIALNVTLFIQYVMPYHASVVAEMPWLRDAWEPRPAINPINLPFDDWNGGFDQEEQ